MDLKLARKLIWCVITNGPQLKRRDTSSRVLQGSPLGLFSIFTDELNGALETMTSGVLGHHQLYRDYLKKTLGCYLTDRDKLLHLDRKKQLCVPLNEELLA